MQHHQDPGPPHAHPGAAGRARIRPDGAELEPGGAAGQQPPHARRGRQRDEEPDADLRRRPADVRQLGVAGDVRADQVGLMRLLQRRRRAEQVGQQVVHDVVEHDRHDDLVRAGPRLEVTDDPAHHRAAGEPADQADDHVDDRRQADREPQVGDHDRAADPLAGGADVEQAGPERQRHREPGQDQRRGLGRSLRERVEDRADRAAVERRGDRVRVDDRTLEQRRVGRRDRLPGRGDRRARRGEEGVPGVQHGRVAERDDQPADHQGEKDRQHRHDRRAALGDRADDHVVQALAPGRPIGLGAGRGRLGGDVRAGVLGARAGSGGRPFTSSLMPVVALWLAPSARPPRSTVTAGARRTPGARLGRPARRRLPPRPRRRGRGRRPRSPATAPAISRPSSATGTVGGRKPVILPSYMTAIRSASA